MDLIIDRLVVHVAPQDSNWLLCFKTEAENSSKMFHIPKKKYIGNGNIIDMSLRLPNVSEGQICSCKCQIDHSETKVCGDLAEDSCSDSFIATKNGAQTHKLQDDWCYTIYWHMA